MHRNPKRKMWVLLLENTLYILYNLYIYININTTLVPTMSFFKGQMEFPKMRGMTVIRALF